MDKSKTPNNLAEDKTVIAGLDNSENNANKVNLIGKCFKNRYLIESKIGHGGMSDIYRAKDLYLESLNVSEPFVAIKVLLPQLSDIPEAQQVLIKESVQTQKLSHPNIIRVYDVDTDDGFHFMVMEWLDGESLDQVIKRSKPMGINFKGSMKIIDQIASALSYAHHQGIVHTDLKPSNIFLTRQGNIKVFDFGVAKNLQQREDRYALAEVDQDSSLTGYTPAYASFEQLTGEDACAEDDIFAFSCISYELLTSKHPYQRVAANEVDVTKNKLVKPKHISMSLWPTLKKGLALKKAQRASSIDQIISTLHRKTWPILTAIAAGTILVIGGFQIQQYYQVQLDNLNNKVAITNKAKSEVQAFEFIPASDLLARIDSIPESKSIIKNGLLKTHQSEVLDIVEQRIASLPKSDNGLYQDYVKIAEVINDIERFYPDSVRLLQMKNQAERSKQLVVDALSERLSLLLSQARYNEQGTNNIKAIVDGLSFVEPNYVYLASNEEYTLYASTFDSALKKHDINQISELITTGENVFANYPEAKSLIAYGAQLKVAVKALNEYHNATAKGKTVDYPYDAAEVYYRDTFEQLTARLEAIDDPKDLHEFDKEVRDLATNLPDDFDPLLTLDKRLAASFLRQANVYLEKQYLKTARELFARGNEMYERLNGVQRL
ncbi:serine/threonine protein kinase [Shewanella sp. SG44-6]|jgi:serine/threonine protein kinase|uniref:serine/threonine-protein kinase n=1 Tax=Shewanella TaxID=22 RepID=UPI001603DDF3|nr:MULTISPECIES: serine/threonine-protein kinase [unclassified Shewanella]MBB1391998.1 serine/threonine protein kinase [Shewanella sp. SG44-6]MBB1477232.1 serine/threonine protein kinase [Shewanella sp. SG41-3]